MLLALSFLLFIQQPTDSVLIAKAHLICRDAIVVDGHIDTPSLLAENRQLNLATGEGCGEFSIPLAKKGGLNGPFMSIYLPADLQNKPGESFRHANFLMDIMDSVIAAHPTQIAHAFSPEDIRRNTREGKISLPYGMENGSGVETSLDNLRHLYKRGIRYITLTHSRHNQIGGSSYDNEKSGRALTDFGRSVIMEMNQLGMLIDLAHVTDSTFVQAARLSKAPPIVSHSSCRHFTPGFERNVSDDLLRLVAEKRGVVMINFGTYFLTKAGNTYSEKRREFLAEFMRANGISDRNDKKVAMARKNWESENPYPFATIDDVIHHIDHAVSVAGIDHVGLGSDFDGVGPTLPSGLKTAEDYPNLVYRLLQKGYSETDIRKILGENVLRVWEEAIEVSRR